MKKKKIKIVKLELPIYRFDIYCCNDEFSKLQQYFKYKYKEKLTNDEDVGGLCWNLQNQNIILIWLNPEYPTDYLENLIHECVHAINYLKNNLNITSNDEFDAYGISYLTTYFKKQLEI